MVYMSPVSPVCHTIVTVSIGLKMYSECEHPFYDIRCPCFKLGNKSSRGPFQIEAPDHYPLSKRRTDLGTLVVLSNSSSFTYIIRQPGVGALTVLENIAPGNQRVIV